MQPALYLAAFLVVAVGIAHSCLGERYILSRLFRRDDLVKGYTARVIRFAWHITSLAWFGFAAVLVLLANPPVTSSALGLVVGCTFLVHFAYVLIASRGRHLSWVAFLVIGIVAIYATR